MLGDTEVAEGLLELVTLPGAEPQPMRDKSKLSNRYPPAKSRKERYRFGRHETLAQDSIITDLAEKTR